eukprot:EC726763.1.p5 GENE.EC726763.1~~EC726763.1.p5  ORF type:complete len:50 (-),score=0.90 EC726763.1:69-218(-)
MRIYQQYWFLLDALVVSAVPELFAGSNSFVGTNKKMYDIISRGSSPVAH